MSTIDHVTLRASDLESNLGLYTKLFELLEFAGERSEGEGFFEWNDFSLAAADAEHPPTRNVHIGFAATSREQVNNWWSALTVGGYQDDGAPGPRPEYGPSYYGAFLRDRDNNSIEAVHHESSTPETGVIDHLWIRVHDLAASKRFYGWIASAVGITARERPGGRLQLICDSGTVSLLADTPTENLHLAFGVRDNDTVRRFHEAALAAGGRDNGAPGERPQYHPGYYGAYVLDPGGNNVEAVCHNREL
jgi:catechol 2,3-dioxygenase-like lactoylglutathione lyase family enzyme